MKKLDLYKTASITALESLEIPPGPALDKQIAEVAQNLSLNESDNNFFKQQVNSIRAVALTFQRADEQAAKQAEAKAAAAAKKPTPPAAQ